MIMQNRSLCDRISPGTRLVMFVLWSLRLREDRSELVLPSPYFSFSGRRVHPQDAPWVGLRTLRNSSCPICALLKRSFTFLTTRDPFVSLPERSPLSDDLRWERCDNGLSPTIRNGIVRFYVAQFLTDWMSERIRVRERKDVSWELSLWKHLFRELSKWGASDEESLNNWSVSAFPSAEYQRDEWLSWESNTHYVCSVVLRGSQIRE